MDSNVESRNCKALTTRRFTRSRLCAVMNEYKAVGSGGVQGLVRSAAIGLMMFEYVVRTKCHVVEVWTDIVRADRGIVTTLCFGTSVLTGNTALRKRLSKSQRKYIVRV